MAPSETIDDVRRDRDEWKQQHENLLVIHRTEVNMLLGLLGYSETYQGPETTFADEALAKFRAALAVKPTPTA